MDFPEPTDFNLSKLYSREFYSAVRKLLNPDGYIVFDAPGVKTINNYETYDLAENAFLYLNTLYGAGFKSLITYESEMEADNEKAISIVRRAIGSAEELTVVEKDVEKEQVLKIKGQDKIISKVLSDFIADSKQRFIFAKVNPVYDDLSYIDFGLDLNVLNEKRYNLSIDYNSRIKEFDFDEKKVNSILRPTLPNPEFWWRLKIPY